MTEEIIVEMKWETAVPLLLEVYANSTPQGRREAREQLLQCAKIADVAVQLRGHAIELDGRYEGFTGFPTTMVKPLLPPPPAKAD